MGKLRFHKHNCATGIGYRTHEVFQCVPIPNLKHFWISNIPSVSCFDLMAKMSFHRCGDLSHFEMIGPCRHDKNVQNLGDSKSPIIILPIRIER